MNLRNTIGCGRRDQKEYTNAVKRRNRSVGGPQLRRGMIVAAALAGGIAAGSAHQALADLVWVGGSGSWSASGGTQWSGGPWVNNSVADFNSPAGTVTVVSPTSAQITADGLDFGVTGYTLSSSAANNTLILASPGAGAAPTVTVGASMTETIGTEVSGGSGPNNLVLGGSAGLTVSGGGTLVLANAITLGGGITVNNSTLAEGVPGITSGNISYQYLNNNNLALNGSTFIVNSTNSPSSTTQLIGNMTVTGSSTISMNRGNTAASSSITFGNSLTMAASSTLTFSMGGNTSTNGAVQSFPSTILTGNNVTFVDYENATQNASGATSGAPFGENGRLGTYTDNGNSATFLSGGSSTLAGTAIRISSTIATPSTATGSWTLGSNSVPAPDGVSLDLNTTSGSVGGITTGAITVNPYSQLWLDGVGSLSWGGPAQTINMSGIGTVTPAAAATSATGGALELGNTTTGQLGDTLNSNVNMVAASSISINPSTISAINGNITGVGPLTIVGGGTVNLGGTANSWTGGTIINSGSVIVNTGSSLSSSVGPVALASSGTTPTNTNLTLNTPQTIGSFSASFVATSGTASNTVKLNGVNLNIVQTANGSFGPGAVPTLTSTISDGTVAGGSISLDAASTATLSLTGPNTYTGGTTVNGGTLLVNNPTGSGTGTGAVAVNSGASLGGSGTIAGIVTVNAGTLLPGSNSGGAHLAGTFTLGGLNFAPSATLSGTLDFNLNTPGSSDLIALGSGSLGLGTSANTIPINLTNLGALGAGTYPLITYSGVETGLFTSMFVNPATEPAGFGFTLQNNSGVVDLVVTPPPALTWSGGSGSWDTNPSDLNWNSSTAAFANGDSVVFDDTSPGTAPFTVTIANGGVAPGLVTFANNSDAYTLTGGPITGNSTLVVSGTGSVTLQSANTFTGVVAVDGGGTLNINADNELGNSSNNVSLTSSSSSQLSTLEVTTSFLTARGITLYSVGGGIDVTGANTFTVSGGLAGTGGLTKLDTGTLLLTSTSNSYAGPTNVSAGTLQMGAAGAIPAFTNLTVATNAVFDTQTFSNNVGSIAGAGTIKIGTGATLTTGFDNASTIFSGSITGVGSLGKTGSGNLTLSGASNSFSGGFPIGGGGTVFGGTGGLGTGVITLSGGSTLQLTSSSFTFGGSGNPTLGIGTGGGALIAPPGAAVTLPTLAGANPLSISGGGVVVTSSSTTAGGSCDLTIGTSTDGGDTLVVGSTDSSGNVGITSVTAADAGGTVTLEPGSTFYQNATITNPKFGVQIGFKAPASGAAADTLGTPAALATSAGGLGAATGIGTLTLNNNTTWEASGFNAYSAGSPTVATAAAITIDVPNAGDTLIDNTAWRAVSTGDTLASITVEGDGLYQICSGAITTTMYAGSWNVDMGSTGKFVIENIPGGTGETLNAIGYNGSSGLGWAGVTNPITATGGTILFGADGINPGDSTPPQHLDSFRSTLTINGPTAIGSTGFEYSSSTTGTTGAIFDTTPVTANIAGEIDLFSTLTVDTFDPLNPSTGGRSLNFNTNGTGVASNFIWGPNSTLIVTSNGTTGGQLSFGRTSGIISVSNGATLEVNAGSTVNVAYIPGVSTVTAPDPLTDSNNPNQSVSVIDDGSIDWAGRTAAEAGSGFKVYGVDDFLIGAGGTAVLNQPDQHGDRSVLVASELTFAGGPGSWQGQLDITSNDMIVHNPDSVTAAAGLAQITSQIKQGYNSGHWNGSAGILSSVAAGTSNTAIGVELNADASGNPLVGSFDGQSVTNTDILMKYTYFGDANLDGVVNGSDYTLIDNGFNNSLTGWRNGDFNYDGVVNGDDYTLIDNAFNTQGASLAGLAGSPAEMIAANTSQIAGSSSAAVPEPASLGLIALLGTGLFMRRRRRS